MSGLFMKVLNVFRLIAFVCFFGCTSAGLADELRLTCDPSHADKSRRLGIADLSSIEVLLSSSFNQVTMSFQISAEVIHVTKDGDRNAFPRGRYMIYRQERMWVLTETDKDGSTYYVQVVPFNLSTGTWSIFETATDAHGRVILSDAIFECTPVE